MEMLIGIICIFIQENAFGNVVRISAAILFRPQCGKAVAWCLEMLRVI